MITQERLHQVLHYEACTGKFYWKVRVNNAIKLNQEAGCVSGYDRKRVSIQIRLDRVTYYAHRLAFLYVHGFLPGGPIDHINGIATDNRIINLRSVSCIKNNRNRAVFHNSTTGIPGVRFRKDGGVYSVTINKGKTRWYLGCFEDFFEACCKRKSAEVKNGYHKNHGRSKVNVY